MNPVERGVFCLCTKDSSSRSFQISYIDHVQSNQCPLICLIGNPCNGYITPYYWVDDHPLLYGNNGSLDPGTYVVLIKRFHHSHIFLIYCTYPPMHNTHAHTVDGRNPAPPGNNKTLKIMGYSNQPQLVGRISAVKRITVYATQPLPTRSNIFQAFGPSLKDELRVRDELGTFSGFGCREFQMAFFQKGWGNAKRCQPGMEIVDCHMYIYIYTHTFIFVCM